jgi:predicted MFS family arabinose efflux permease
MNPWRGVLALPRQAWLVCGCTLVNRMGTMAYGFLALYLVQVRHWTDGAAGDALLVCGAGALVSAPVAGPLADRVGHGAVLRWSLWGSGAMLMVLPLVGGRLPVLACVFLWHLLLQSFWPSSMALLTGLVEPDQRRAVFALHRTVSNLGLAAGPALGGVLAMVDFRWVFWTDGLSTLLSGLMLSLLLRSGAVPDRSGGGEAAEGGRRAWRDGRLARLLLAFLPALMVFWQISGPLPLRVVRDLGFSSRFFGLIFTANTLIIVAVEVPLNLAMAHWRHGRAFALGALLIAAGFGGTGLARTHGAILALVAVWTFGEMILFPATADAVAALAPAHRRGEYMGLYSLTFALAIALGPWLGVRAYAQVGAGAVWTGCLLAGCASAAALWPFRLDRDRDGR